LLLSPICDLSPHAAFLRILEAMDLAIPAAESDAAAAAAAGAEQQRRDVARCGEAERPLRLAFRLLLLHLRHAPEARVAVSAAAMARSALTIELRHCIEHQSGVTPHGGSWRC